MHAEEPDRQQGSGHLILRDGTEVPVEWEIYLLPDATIRSGIVRGDPMRLLMAAENRLVIFAARCLKGRRHRYRRSGAGCGVFYAIVALCTLVLCSDNRRPQAYGWRDLCNRVPLSNG